MPYQGNPLYTPTPEAGKQLKHLCNPRIDLPNYLGSKGSFMTWAEWIGGSKTPPPDPPLLSEPQVAEQQLHHGASGALSHEPCPDPDNLPPPLMTPQGRLPE